MKLTANPFVKRQQARARGLEREIVIAYARAASVSLHMLTGGVAQPDLVIDVAVLQAHVGQHQIGLQQGESLLIDEKGVADLGQAADRLGIVAVRAHADQQVAGTGGVHEFCEVRRQGVQAEFGPNPDDSAELLAEWDVIVA